jgi:hypothetical protein
LADALTIAGTTVNVPAIAPQLSKIPKIASQLERDAFVSPPTSGASECKYRRYERGGNKLIPHNMSYDSNFWSVQRTVESKLKTALPTILLQAARIDESPRLLILVAAGDEKRQTTVSVIMSNVGPLLEVWMFA